MILTYHWYTRDIHIGDGQREFSGTEARVVGTPQSIAYICRRCASVTYRAVCVGHESEWHFARFLCDNCCLNCDGFHQHPLCLWDHRMIPALPPSLLKRELLICLSDENRYYNFPGI